MPFPDYPNEQDTAAVSPRGDNNQPVDAGDRPRYDTFAYEADQRRLPPPGPISPDGLQMPPGGRLLWQPHSGTYAVVGPDGQYLGIQGADVANQSLRRAGEPAMGDVLTRPSLRELDQRVPEMTRRSIGEMAGSGGAPPIGEGLRRARLFSEQDAERAAGQLERPSLRELGR